MPNGKKPDRLEELRQWLAQPKLPRPKIDLPQGQPAAEYVTPPDFMASIRVLHELEQDVDSSSVGRSWPLIVDKGTVRLLVCHYVVEFLESGPFYPVLFEAPDGMVYAASGHALAFAEDNGWESLDSISKDPAAPLEERIAPLLEVAEALIREAGLEIIPEPSIVPTSLN